MGLSNSVDEPAGANVSIHSRNCIKHIFYICFLYLHFSNISFLVGYMCSELSSPTRSEQADSFFQSCTKKTQKNTPDLDGILPRLITSAWPR